MTAGLHMEIRMCTDRAVAVVVSDRNGNRGGSVKKILIAVDDTKGSEKAFSVGGYFCSCIRPENIVLLYVEKFEGRSLMAEMLGDAKCPLSGTYCVAVNSGGVGQEGTGAPGPL